jgi:ATP-dependent Clp protease ATP-binding subunit ClpC
VRINFTVGVYKSKEKDSGTEQWCSLIPASYEANVSGQGDVKLRERLIDQLRKVLQRVPPSEQELFQLPLGTELVRVPVDLKLEGGRVHGTAPLIVEPRWTGPEQQRLFVYHPTRRDEWFIVDARSDVADTATVFFRHHWKRLSEDVVAALLSNGKDRLVQIAFSAEPHSLLDQLPSRKKDPRVRASAPRLGRVLSQLATDETQRLTSDDASGEAGTARAVVPRAPYRERLSYLLGGPRPRSVAVIGPPGSGKTSLIQRWIADRLVEDGYPLHKNLDRVFHVWRLTGKRLIAGMSGFGEWEERCLSVLDEARKHRAILWVDDLHLWGRLGQSRQSERSFADFFRGPVRRGDLAIIAELLPEQHARLERDAPGLAEALAAVTVPAASPGETAQLLLHEVRALELRLPIALHPFVPRTATELGAALFPWRARPGVAIEIVRRVAERAAAERASERTAERGGAATGGAAVAEIGPADVLDHVARTTGLSPKLISLDEPLDAAEVEAAFARRVIGQPAATRAAANVILKVRAGLADPHRPIHVMLFTGPTGTGKTELATAIAEYLYGGGERLLRVDMGELSGPDAVARLIGDRWNPEGLLTSRVRAQPFCVVLLDEIEKAHPQALHLLLQLFDEGRLTDAAGDVASFASAVVIMTSNLGSKNASPIGFGETRDRVLAEVARAVREFFPVELFNRIDQVVPFEPLTPEVAAKVVDKELAKLLARRGLRERNTFVYAGTAIRRRAVADAFDPRYGARTVKRWLEDKIGGTLTDLLASAPPARLRIVRITEDAGQMVASLEPMQEKTAVPGPYLLEGALDLATAALEAPIAAALAALRRAGASPILRRAREEAVGEVRFYVDDLEQRLGKLTELLGGGERRPALAPARGRRGAPPGPRRARADDGADDDDDDDDLDPRGADDDLDDHDDPIYEEVGGDPWRKIPPRTRVVRPPPQAHRPPAARDALLAAIAEALLIERALPTLLDPDAHAVTVVLSRVGATADAAGLAIAATALADPAWIDELACIDAGGTVRALKADAEGLALLRQYALGKLAPPIPESARGKAVELARARDVALTLRGLFVRAALEGDHGTWMIRAAAAEPDVVRVELRPGAREQPDAVLRAHVAGRAELDRVLEQGGTLPPNPDVLLPVTRTLTYRTPLRPGEPYGVEIEDFATGWVDRGTARDLVLAIRRAWHLAWSRVGSASGPGSGGSGSGGSGSGGPRPGSARGPGEEARP